MICILMINFSFLNIFPQNMFIKGMKMEKSTDIREISILGLIKRGISLSIKNTFQITLRSRLAGLHASQLIWILMLIFLF